MQRLQACFQRYTLDSQSRPLVLTLVTQDSIDTVNYDHDTLCHAIKTQFLLCIHLMTKATLDGVYRSDDLFSLARKHQGEVSLELRVALFLFSLCSIFVQFFLYAF
jgi:hypothetical protein